MEKDWASLEDFSALFQYYWHRDFPIDSKRAVGARRADWTIHIGIVVRNIADLMGLIARFEHGSRKDAVLRSTEGDEIALEWEWGGVCGDEMKKLREHTVWSASPKQGNRLLKYAVFITYTHAVEEIQVIYDKVAKEWSTALWPLLLILIQVGDTKELSSRRKFNKMIMSRYDKGVRQELRSSRAVPWMIAGTRWSYEQL